MKSPLNLSGGAHMMILIEGGEGGWRGGMSLPAPKGAEEPPDKRGMDKAWSDVGYFDCGR